MRRSMNKKYNKDVQHNKTLQAYFENSTKFIKKECKKLNPRFFYILTLLLFAKRYFYLGFLYI